MPMAVIEKLVVEGGSGGPWRVGVRYEKHIGKSPFHVVLPSDHDPSLPSFWVGTSCRTLHVGLSVLFNVKRSDMIDLKAC